MKTTKQIDIKLEIELSPQDIIEFVQSKKLVPQGWDHWSAEVIGKPVSEGAKIVLRHSELEVI